MTDKKEPENLAEDVVPTIKPHPTVTRGFEPAPWHRPRKQFIRRHQWNYEIVEQVVNKRAANAADAVLRVFGLPSSEYLDLLSMRDLCEEHDIKVVYLGFNASYSRPTDGRGAPGQPKAVDLYEELQTERMIDASSFVHPSSSLVPDLFEQIRIQNSMAHNVLNRFSDFDVINLDICGCIIRPESDRATEALEAVAELLRWQSVRRLAPWLFFVTTFASPDEINLAACDPLINAVKTNADDCAEFRNELQDKAKLDIEAFMACFKKHEGEARDINHFIRIFALALGKWLAARLRLPNPPSFASMLRSYCFRHRDIPDPHLLSLAYLIEPAPSPGAAGVDPGPTAQHDYTPKYRKHAKKIVGKSFEIHDLDELMKADAAKRKEMANETEEMLVSCGFDAATVGAFIAQYR